MPIRHSKTYHCTCMNFTFRKNLQDSGLTYKEATVEIKKAQQKIKDACLKVEARFRTAEGARLHAETINKVVPGYALATEGMDIDLGF